LNGMRERAKNIPAELDFRQELGTGYEVALRIPGSVAYQTRPAGASSFYLSKGGTKL